MTNLIKEQGWKSIYDLKLHEAIHINQLLSVRRVPLWWMYEYIWFNQLWSCTFIPYNDEFKIN